MTTDKMEVDFPDALENTFRDHADTEIASAQKAYMKNLFEFYGIKTPVRREIQKPFLDKTLLPPKEKLETFTKTLWGKPHREFQYLAQELVQRYVRLFEKEDISLFEFMITHKSWWDTVDFIASKLVGEYFKIHPEQRNLHIEKWIASGNLWLQRTAILFQLGYKSNVDTELLANIINALLGSQEFFINKAVGWMLRQYSKTDPEWVMDFCNRTPLDKLSRREALRLTW